MNNPPSQGGVVAQRNIKSETYMSSCVDCPAKDGLITILPQEKRVQVDCKLLDGMVYGSLINTRELVRKILANNPEIQCPVIASANRLITTTERVLEEALSQQLKDLEANAKKEAVTNLDKERVASTPINPGEANSIPSDSTEAEVAVPINLDEEVTVASTPTGEEAVQL